MAEQQQKTLPDSDKFEHSALIYDLFGLGRNTIEKMEEGVKEVISKYWGVHKIKETEGDKYRGRIVNVEKIESEYKIPLLEKAVEICGADTLINENMLRVSKKKFDEFLKRRGIQPKDEFYTLVRITEKYDIDIVGPTQEITDPTIKKLEGIVKELTELEKPVYSSIAELQAKLEKPEGLLKELEESLKALGKK